MIELKPAAAACDVTAAPNVSLGTITASAVDLSWPAVTNAVSYNVYRGGVLVQNVAATNFQDTGRTGNTSYSYTVAGVGTGACEGPLSTADVALTLPGQPTGLAFSAISATATTVSWTAPTGGAASYDVYRDAALVQNQAGTSYANSPLTPDTNYSYYIVARNATGTGTASATSSQRTYAATPAAPSLSGATGSSLNVAIGSDTNPGTVAYAIRINGGAFTNQYVQADGTVGAAAVWQTAGVWGTRIVTGLVASTTYTFDVKARNGDLVETAFGTTANLATTAVNNNTTTGAVSATAGDQSATVSAAYTGDSNANNTLLVEWGTCTGLGACNGTTFPNSSGVIAHQASPYNYTITGLTNGTIYQVRVTFVENGGNTVSGTNPTVIVDVAPANFLTHNSMSTASTKWAGNGGWGLTGTKYGQITCATCHTDTTTNIKRVRTVISTPDGSNWTSTGTPTVAVTLTDTRNATSDFGDDAGGHATSTKVCEACHSQNKFHNYNTANNTGGLTHQNRQDCLACHPHKNGFDAAGCDTCHGYPPPPLSDSPVTGSATAGAHAAHAAATFDCDSCHGAGSKDNGGAAHGTGQIAISFAAFGSTAGTYNGQSAVTAGYTGAGAGAANDTLTCNSVYCHGGTISGTAPVWDTPASGACGTCHDATAGTVSGLPSGTSHNTHANVLGLTCDECHGAGFGATGHVTGTVAWNVTGLPNTGSTATYRTSTSGATSSLPPSSPYGSCANIQCHYGATPAWNTSIGAAPDKCVTCHNDGDGGTTLLDAVPAATKVIHTTHNNANNSYVPSDCDACHGTGASAGTHTGHANGSLTLGNDLTAYNSGNANCTNSCHIATATGLWDGTPPALACLDCHAATYIASGAIPATGLHAVSASGVQKHDNTLSDGVAGNGVGCGECHVTEPATHLDGNYSATDANNNNTAGTSYRWVTRANMTYTEIAPASGNSGTCSGTGLSGCHSDGGVWYRRWSTEANQAYSGTTLTSKCNVCHGQWATWAAGTTHYKAGGTNAANNTRGSGHEPAAPSCDNCHAYATVTGRHNTATHLVTVNTNNNAGYERVATNAGCDNGGCHAGAADTAHNFPVSVFSNETVSGPSLPSPPCSSCHNDAAKAAAGVPQVVIAASGSSTHVDADGPGGSTYTINVAGFTAQCENCHAGHADGTSGANDVEIKVYYGTPVLGSAGAITFNAATNTITRASGLNVFPVNSVINVSGASNAANNRNFTVTASAAGSLTVSPTGVLVNEAASTTASIASQVPTMNYGYGTHSRSIKLGGTATSGSTEAEMCWACHDLRTVSEWGANNNADTGSLAYNYGQLYEDAATVPGTTTSNWTTGYWRSGKGLNSTLTTNPYWYKRGKVRSTHSANYDGTTVASGSDGTNWKAGLSDNSGGYTTTYNKNETLDAVANIRCSYCHDVHGTHNGVNGDNSSTTVNTGPYLRGTWLGNPYNEDGAPRYGMTAWSTQGGGTTIANGNPDYGLVPRGSADPASSGLAGLGVGGWWIDQNSNNPVANHATTAFRTATGNAGLCDQCHGSTKDGTWTATEIGAIDQVTGENLWVSGFNGHANSVIGGSMTETGTNLQWDNTAKSGRNIFNRTVRNNSAVASYSSASHANADMGLATHTSGRGYSYRSSSGGSTGYGWLPRVNNTDTGTTGGEYTVYRYFAWNNTSYQTTARNSNIATGTALLYVTMEPDATTETAHNAQANYHTFSCSKCHNPHASRLPKLMITNCLDTNHNTWEDKSTYTGSALPAPWTGIRHSNWAAAQNCHRLDSRATGTTSDVTLGSGWNKVTPWIEDTTPNGTLTGDLTTLPAY